MGPHALPLGRDEVHVWSAGLDQSADELAALSHLLSAEERERLARIRCTRTHAEFAAARGLLRSLLGAYLEVDASQIRFAVGSAGKPELTHPADSGLQFNVSHSHGVALFAVTRLCPVGVDVEHVRPVTNYLGLAERYFSPREVEILTGLPDEHRPAAFFHAWTRKEAFLKAIGIGLSFGLERVEVTLRPGEAARLTRLDGEERRARTWSLCHLAPQPGFVGALALEHLDYRLVCRQWPDGRHF